MKTIYSLKEFSALVSEITESIREDYFNVRVEYKASSKELEFSAYIHGYNWVSFPTMEEVLNKLREDVRGINKETQDDVEIDIIQEDQPPEPQPISEPVENYPVTDLPF